MNTEKIKPIVKGIIKHIPGMKKIFPNTTGGTNESRYCYTVWMRHLENWKKERKQMPVIVAELGPGDSLGIGLAALLSGCEQVYALDVIKYWDNNRNLRIFEELVEMFKNKTEIPGNDEYPQVRPPLESNRFPSDIISEALLNKSLSDERIAAIRNEIIDIDNLNNRYISYKIPWNDPVVIEQNTIDFIYSQAVLEHVEDLENTYNAMIKWLKPDGLMSHTIDFRSHNTTKIWNGHWIFSEFEWKLVKGGRAFKINRQPVSKHNDLHKLYGFKVLATSFAKKENQLTEKKLAKRFKNLTEEDLTTSGIYMLSRKA